MSFMVAKSVLAQFGPMVIGFVPIVQYIEGMTNTKYSAVQCLFRPAQCNEHANFNFVNEQSITLLL